jgi:hypothetical protein
MLRARHSSGAIFRASTKTRDWSRAPDRSVAGGGVRERAASSARSAGVMSTFTAASESLSCSTLRAPMIGAVTAGWAPTQAIAVLTGWRSLCLQKATYFSATSNIHASP